MSQALLRIQRAFEARVAAITSEPVVQYEGQPFEPVQGQPWISAQTSGRDRQPMGVSGTTPHLWRGTFNITVKHPASEGLRPAYARAQAIASHFPRGLTMTESGQAIIVQQVGFPPAYTTAGWITQPVTIAWYSEEVA